MSSCVRDAWYEHTSCQSLNCGVGLVKLSSGFAIGWLGARMAPKLSSVTVLTASTVLDLLPILSKGCDVDNSFSYRSKTASLFRGAQLATFVYLFSATIDRLDVALEDSAWGWHLLDSQALTQALGGGCSGLFLLFSLYVAGVSSEASRDVGYYARCPGCRFLDCEPTWALPAH